MESGSIKLNIIKDKGQTIKLEFKLSVFNSVWVIVALANFAAFVFLYSNDLFFTSALFLIFGFISILKKFHC